MLYCVTLSELFQYLTSCIVRDTYIIIKMTLAHTTQYQVSFKRMKVEKRSRTMVHKENRMSKVIKENCCIAI